MKNRKGKVSNVLASVKMDRLERNMKGRSKQASKKQRS